MKTESQKTLSSSRILVVLEADEDARPADPRVGEAEPDAETQRIGQEAEQEDRRRQHEQEAERVAAVVERRRGTSDRSGDAVGGCAVVPVPCLAVASASRMRAARATGRPAALTRQTVVAVGALLGLRRSLPPALLAPVTASANMSTST